MELVRKVETTCQDLTLRVGFTTCHQEVATKEMVSEMDLEVEEDNLLIVAERLHQLLVQVYAPSADRIHVFAA